jgi:hypothetical protein
MMARLLAVAAAGGWRFAGATSVSLAFGVLQ